MHSYDHKCRIGQWLFLGGAYVKGHLLFSFKNEQTKNSIINKNYEDDFCV